MNLDTWLKQDHSLADQLAVVAGLCNAVNEAHEKGVLHRALEPANIEVGSGGACDLQLAVRPDAATPAAARYRAPEVLEGASYSPRADIYSVGVICYEMLSGRNPAGNDRPKPLSELRPEVSRDLTDAVMGCMEKSPDWRPRDLSFLLQVVGVLTSTGKAAARPARAAEPPRAVTAAPRRPARGPSSRSSVPLVAVGVVVVLGAAAGAWFWLRSQGGSAPASRPVASAPTPQATPSLEAVASATPTAQATAPPKPAAEAPKPTVTARGEQPRPVATPLPTPRPQAEPTAAPVRVAEALPAPTPTPRAPEPAEAAVLTALSPLTLKRATTAILDLRGAGLRPDHQVRFMKIKTPPNGISVVRQKYVGSTLIQVAVKVDENAAPGSYGLDLEDAKGVVSNSLVFTVTK